MGSRPLQVCHLVKIATKAPGRHQWTDAACRDRTCNPLGHGLESNHYAKGPGFDDDDDDDDMNWIFIEGSNVTTRYMLF